MVPISAREERYPGSSGGRDRACRKISFRPVDRCGWIWRGHSSRDEGGEGLGKTLDLILHGVNQEGR